MGMSRMTKRSPDTKEAHELVAAWRYRVRPAKTDAFLRTRSATSIAFAPLRLETAMVAAAW
jgi:hypothetical protein